MGRALERRRTKQRPSALLRVAVATAALLGAACQRAEEPPPPEIRPVRTVTIEERKGGETVTLTGRIEAEEEVRLAFRVGQRMIERTVNVGDRVVPGQLVARLESTTFDNSVQTAQANLAAAQASATDARLELERQQTLLARGVAPRVRVERAQKANDVAVAQVRSAQAQLATAREQRSYTELFADSAGAVVEVGAEPGEVVGAGQMIVRIARKGGRDAIFDVPPRVKDAAAGLDPEVEVTLTADPNVRAVGRVREVAPVADPVTRTFEVKVGLTDPPDAMRLGTTVNGTIRLGADPGITIPASALTSSDGAPAVWIVDTDDGTVSLRPVEVARFGIDDVAVRAGLAPDDVVVTAGVQTLRPGQKVRLLQATP